MTQPTYKIDQWTDAHSQGLTIGEQANAIRIRDHEASKLVKYVEPESEVQPYKSPAHAISALVVALAPPVVGIVAVGAVVWVMVAATAAVVAAVFAFVNTYALWIGGGALALVVVVGALPGKSDEPKPQTSGNGGQNISVTVNVAGQNVTTNAK